MNATAPSSVRSLLRERTQPLHDEVDKAFGAYVIDEASGYAAFLSAHASALVPIERHLEAVGVARLLPDWPARARTAALAADLTALGRPMPPADEWSGCASPAECWGVLYVLEGSRLGARFLARRLAPSAPAAYLRHGEGSRLWPDFLAALEANTDLAQASALSAGAHAAFGAFMEAARRHTPPAQG